jgi:WD40 repeat protein
MTEFMPSPEFEEKLRLALATPEPDPGFEKALRSRLSARAGSPVSRRSFRLRPVWVIPLGLVLLVVLAVLAIGPQRVAAEMKKLFGYIPGFGIVDQNASLRMLEGPVTQTRAGITVTVKQAFLTSDKTVLTYTMEGVPWSALSHNENVAGCSGAANLRLPDGSLLMLTGGGGTPQESTINYPPIPANVNQATFFLPCILDTLPGLAPENWELPLRFTTTSPDLTVMPVIQVAPSPEPQVNTPSASANPLALLKVVNTGDNYVLLGEFRPSQAQDPSLPAGSWWSLTDPVMITDASGQEVFYTTPSDPNLLLPPSQPDAEPWVYQIGKTFTPPLTLTYTGRYTIPVDPTAQVKIEFDAGTNPQPGQEWVLNQDFEIAGHKVRLVSIQALAQSGYGFSFESSDPAVQTVNVDISGYIPHGRSEPVGENAGPTPGKWSEDLLDYDELPTGKLKVVLSNLTLYGEPQTWQLQWSPETARPGSPALYGISLAIDKYIPLDDGYYLIGHTAWTDGRITSAWPAGWALKAYDARGQEVALEPADWQDAGLTPEANQWLYRLYGKSFNAPLTIRATQMNVTFKQPVKLTLDLRSYGFDGSQAQLGLIWKLGGLPLDVPGLPASVFKVTYIKLGDMKGFEIGINADPALQGLPFTIESGLDTSGMAAVSSGGGSNQDASGLVSTVLTNAKITFPLVLSASGATVNATWEATWEATWNPPAGDPNAIPATFAQACVTLDAWKQAAGNPLPLPTGLPDRVLVSRGALSPDPSLFISSLDGSTNLGLVFGQGSLSPDGTQLAYSGADDHLYVMDVSTKQSTLLTNNTSDLRPLWSPDGTRIAFSRLTDKGYNVFVMDADGRNVHALTDTTENTLAAGWTPDSQKVIGVGTKDGGELVQLLDVVNSTAQELNFIRQSGNVDVSISPDGQWVAFVNKVLGRMAPGIFISRLDGSDKRLLVQLDTWSVGRPRWSPDGNWLAFTLMDADQYSAPPTPALFNVATCQVVPLNGLNGEIEEWVK